MRMPAGAGPTLCWSCPVQGSPAARPALLVLSTALPACLRKPCCTSRAPPPTHCSPTHCRSLVKVLREGAAGVLPESFQLLALECLLACFVLANLTLPPDALASPAPSATVDALIKRIK